MILVFGTVCLDRVMRIPSLPLPGGYVEVGSEQLMLGGEAANTANMLQTWGSDYVLAGNGAGGGEDAIHLKNLIAEKGLAATWEHEQVRGHTPVCHVYVTDDGERTMIGRGFAALGSTVDVSRLPFAQGGWMTADMNLAGASREAVRQAHDHGMRTYAMDFVQPGDPIYPDSVWQSSTDWTGVRGNPGRNLEVVRGLHTTTGATAILTDGAAGFVVAGNELTARHLPAFRAVSFVDATGSGDAFRAGVLYGLDHGWPLMTSLRFASAAGCLMCQVLGGTGRVPRIEEVEQLIASQPEIASAYE